LKNKFSHLVAYSKILIVFLFSSISVATWAQPTTSTPNAPNTVDIIHMKDGRVLRGEILIFEEKDGDITFKDIYGRKYSITRQEYVYFEENQLVQERKRKNDTIVKVRKENQFEFSVGLSYASFVPTTRFSPDAYYKDNFNNSSYFPISLQIGVGKYFNRKNFIGANINYALIGGLTPSMQTNLRYQYQYDAYKKNVACYIPVEVGFHTSNYSTSFFVNDSISIDQYSWTTQVDTKLNVKSGSIGVGHGFNFMLKNTHSLGIELLIYKYFIFNQTFDPLPHANPTFELSSAVGAKLAFLVHI